MKYVYRVFKNVQKCDGDAWDHWIDEETISYHSSKEKAEAEIVALLEGDENITRLTECLNGSKMDDYQMYDYECHEVD